MDRTFDAAADVVRQVLVDEAGEDNPSRLARNVLHALMQAGLWHPRLVPAEIGALRVQLHLLDLALDGVVMDRSAGQANDQVVSVAPPTPPAAAPTPAVQEAVDLWNDLARRCELPRVTKVTGPRRNLIAARLRDCGGRDGWTAALAKIEANPFFTGQKPGRDGQFFKADLDFIIKESTFVRLMEGGYDERPAAAPNTAGGTHAGFHHPSGRRGADQRSYGTVDGGEAARRGILDGLADELEPQHPG